MNFRKARSKGNGCQSMPVSIIHTVNAQVVTARNGKQHNGNSKMNFIN